MTAKEMVALATYDLCDICGMDTWESTMYTCKPCSRHGVKTVACGTCVPMDQQHWFTGHANYDWECSVCT